MSLRHRARTRAAFLSPLTLVATAITGYGIVACGSPPPSASPARPSSPAAPKEPFVDVSPVPEPAGLVVLARVNKPEAIVSAVGSWTRLPLPSGAELVRSITDDDVAELVDLSRPVDAALAVSSERRGLEVLAAFSVPMKSYELARAKLGEKHRLIAGANGQLTVVGLGSKSQPSPTDDRVEDEDGEDEDDDRDRCVLAPAAQGARLVCGEVAALDALLPYLSRTMPRESWTSDVHVELRPEPLRAPLQQMRASFPILVQSFMRSQSTAVRELVDASIGEVVDIADDAQRLTIDAKIDAAGVVTSTRVEFQSTKSLFARALTADRKTPPPPAFWRLPGDTDTAFFGRSADPELFERPRALLANVMLEGASSAGVPEAERRALKDLIVDRVLALSTNGVGIYGKGFDQVAVDKARASLAALGPEDRAGIEEGKRALLEQVIGWHLFRVSEPVAKVGPILKDVATLWSRPALATWAKAKADKAGPPRVRIAPMPQGVTLPKGAVHLEVTIPRAAIEVPPPPLVIPKAPPAAKTKTIARKPIVLHVFAVPDEDATWLGFGLDGKLVAQKAAASLAEARGSSTLGASALGKSTDIDVLRGGELRSGGIATLRGFLVLAALDARDDRSLFSLLGALPNKGAAPLVFTGRAEPASAGAASTSVSEIRISRAVIEDIVKLAMMAR